MTKLINDRRVFKKKKEEKVGGAGERGELAKLNNTTWLNNHSTITIKENFHTCSGTVSKAVDGILMNYIVKIPI